MKTNVVITIILVVAAIVAIGFLDLKNSKREFKPTGMRILILEGNTVIKKEDVPPGRFYFFLTHQGTFYNNTGEGYIYELRDPKLVDPSHLSIIEANIKELNTLDNIHKLRELKGKK